MNQHCMFKEDLNIPGLIYVPNYISSEYECELVKLVDSQIWNLDLKRRTQHYGYKYVYTAKSIDFSDYIGEMPVWLDELCHKLYSESIFMVKPDQVIVNEYIAGQGIAPHIDCVPCFSDVICSLSLVSGCIMDLTNASTKIPIYLEPRSLLILKGDSRYKWKHGIATRKNDN